MWLTDFHLMQMVKKDTLSTLSHRHEQFYFFGTSGRFLKAKLSHGFF
jgi:hypothetical protein